MQEKCECVSAHCVLGYIPTVLPSWGQRKAYAASCANPSTNKMYQWHHCLHADLYQGKSKPAFPAPSEVQLSVDHLLCCMPRGALCQILIKAKGKWLRYLESAWCVVPPNVSPGESGFTKLPGLVHLKAEFEDICRGRRALCLDQLDEDMVAFLFCSCTG